MGLPPISNPPNRHVKAACQLDRPTAATLEVREERAERVLSRNDSPDVPFRWSVNPYRGCYHACAYCYARQTHEWLGLGAGTDFDTRLSAKVNAPEALEAQLNSRRWRGELICFSGNTDCYQPLEARYRLTRACLEVCRRVHNPVSLITKSRLVSRDAELLGAMHREAHATVTISLSFAPDAAGTADARLIEPHASLPAQRLAAMSDLAAAGVPVGVLVAPVIPGLNEHQVPAVLEAARAAGAQWAGMLLLRLPGSVERVFLDRIEQAMPDRAGKIQARLRELRDGRLSDSRFGHRFAGKGPWWALIRQFYEKTRRRLELDGAPPAVPSPTPYRRQLSVRASGRVRQQLTLF